MKFAVEHGHAGESAFAEYLELLLDPAHWGYEVTASAVQGIVMYPILRVIAKRWVERHDRKHHNDHA